jgi:hypothetical protein
MQKMFNIAWTEGTGGNYAGRGFHNLYFSPIIITLTESRRMKWAGHVSCMGDKITFWQGNLKERDHVEGLGVDGRIIFKSNLYKYGVRVRDTRSVVG